MTFDEWWRGQSLRFIAANLKDDAREIWDIATKAEREACAKVVEQFEDDMGYGKAQKIADAIRLRSNV